MFGFFKKKFEAEKHMTIGVTLGGKPLAADGDVPPGTRVRVATDGLAAWKRPELEVVDVPLELVRSAAALLNLVATYCANERAIASGRDLRVVIFR